MKNEDTMPEWVTVIIAVVFFFLGTWVSNEGASKDERKKVQAEAIEAGVGRYTVDPKTGVTTFEFVKQ